MNGTDSRPALPGIGVLVCVLLLGSCATPGVLFQEVADLRAPAVDWAFLQSVGGIDADPPYLANDIVWVSLHMDLSGRRRITVEPTLRNSGLKCGRVSVGRRSNLTGTSMEIELKVHAVEETQPLPPSPPPIPATCEEVPVLLPVEFLGAGFPPFGMTPQVVRIWYRDSLFTRHLIAEYPL